MNRDLLRENRVHGLPTYPVSIYDVTEQDGTTLFDCHWHEELEFILVTEGRVRVQLDMTEVELTAGQAAFVGSGVLHGAFPCDESVCSVYAVVFHADFLASRNDDILQERYIKPLIHRRIACPTVIRGSTATEAAFIRNLEALITANKAEKFAYELATKSHLYMMLSYLLENSHPVTRTSTEESYQVDRLKQALSYIHSNYQAPIRLKDLAAELQMSEEHFCRFFKKMMKRSPIAYVNEYRMQQARMLLITSDSKILDIALQVGFEHLSYFITVFRTHYGVTPSQYRKLHA